jgi:RNA polymerase sigma-70 factor (ECF subfamily)
MAVEGIYPRPTDHALVEAARLGSVAAFEELVARYDTPIRAYLTRLTGDPELAADLTQETFLDVYRSRANLPSDRPFAAWLFQTAHYNLLPVRRRQALRRFTSLDWLSAQVHTIIPALQRPDDTRGSHDRDLIQRVLDQLRPPLRDALVLYTIGGFPSEEVARILGISPGAARKRISRAAEEFRRRYHERQEGEGDR